MCASPIKTHAVYSKMQHFTVGIRKMRERKIFPILSEAVRINLMCIVCYNKDKIKIKFFHCIHPSVYPIQECIYFCSIKIRALVRWKSAIKTSPVIACVEMFKLSEALEQLPVRNRL